MKKRITALLLAALLCMGVIPAGAQGQAEGGQTPEKLTMSETGQAAVQSGDMASQWIEKIADWLRPQLAAHATEMTLSIPVSAAEAEEIQNLGGFRTFLDQVAMPAVNQAMVHTGNSTEGDYILWLCAHKSVHYQVNNNWSFEDYSYHYEVVLNYEMSYYTTAQQEQELTSRLDGVMAALNLNGKNDLQKVTAIYQYITSHVSYDYANLDNSSYTMKYTAYAAQMNGTAVCQGYALLFYRMCLAAGVDCRVVAGTTTTGKHAWNIVRVNGSYYEADCTWDAGVSPENYRYFLKCNSTFFQDHTPNAENSEMMSHINMSAGNMTGSQLQQAQAQAPAQTPANSAQPDAVEFAGFTDVKETDWFAAHVKWAVEEHITSGTGAKSFSPCEICTRGQVVTFLWRAAGSPEAGSADTGFTDVSTDAYYAAAVAWAVENGITCGTSATTFGPYDTCTRAQVVTFLWRAAGSPEAGSADTGFTDVSADAYYAAAVAWAVENGITSGTGAHSFSPDSACSRAEIVTFLDKYEHL